VDIEPIQSMPELVPLPDLRANLELEGMPLLQRFMRLSVQPVSKENFETVCQMGGLSGIPEE
jgi:predicted RNA-binding protein with PUA-like domain